MATLTNKTHKPVSVPLPGGKKLRLGPLKSAEVTPKAVDHPAVKGLVEAGTIEVAGTGRTSGHSSAGPKTGGVSGGARSHSGDSIRKTGDR